MNKSVKVVLALSALAASGLQAMAAERHSVTPVPHDTYVRDSSRPNYFPGLGLSHQTMTGGPSGGQTTSGSGG